MLWRCMSAYLRKVATVLSSAHSAEYAPTGKLEPASSRERLGGVPDVEASTRSVTVAIMQPLPHSWAAMR